MAAQRQPRRTAEQGTAVLDVLWRDLDLVEGDGVEAGADLRREDQWPELAFGIALGLSLGGGFDTHLACDLALILGAIKDEGQTRAVGCRRAQAKAERFTVSPRRRVDGELQRQPVTQANRVHPPWAGDTRCGERGVDTVKLVSLAAAAVDEAQLATEQRDAVELHPLHKIAASQISGGTKTPVTVARFQPLDAGGGLFDIDALDIDAAIEQSSQRHAHHDTGGGRELLLLKPRRIGDVDIFHHELRPRKQPRRDVAGDRHVAASEFAPIIFEIGPVAVPVDDQGRQQQRRDHSDQQDAKIKDGRLPEFHGRFRCKGFASIKWRRSCRGS